MTNNLEYQILNKSDIQNIYQDAYSRYQNMAHNFAENSNLFSKFQETDLLINLLTKLIIFSYKYGFELSELLYNITKLNSITKIKEYYTSLKKETDLIVQKLKKMEDKGLQLRKMYHWDVPSFFKKTSRVYIKVKPILPEKLLIQEMLEQINFLLPLKDQINLHIVSQKRLTHDKKEETYHQYWFIRNKQPIKIGRFFQTLISQTEKLCNFFEKEHNENDIKHFLNIIDSINEHTNFTDISNKIKNETILPPGRIDIILLNYIKKIEPKNQKDLLSNLKEFLKRQKEFAYLFNEIQIKTYQNDKENENQNINIIDTLIFSIVPRDISTISTFTPWNSCMKHNGIYFNDIHKQIASLSIVVYGINSQNPYKRLSRILLKPFISEKSLKIAEENYNLSLCLQGIPSFISLDDGTYIMAQNNVLYNEISTNHNLSINNFTPERFYFSDQTFGLQNDLFRQITDQIAHKHINTKNYSGKVFQATDYYSNTLKSSYEIYDVKDEDNLLTYLKQNEIPHKHFHGYTYINTLSLLDTNLINLKKLRTHFLSLNGELIARNGIKGNVVVNRLTLQNASCVFSMPSKIKILETLKIQDPKLKYLPKNIKTNRLDLTGTKIKSIPQNINITELNLRGTPVKSIPYIKNLKKLSISYCKNNVQLSEKLNLKILEATYCENLTELPQQLCVTERLDLHNSNIHSIPKNLKTNIIHIYNCKNIKYLDKSIQCNHLYASRSGLLSLPKDFNATYINLNFTQLSEIPENLNVKKASFNDCPIQKIHPSVKAKELFVEGTKISEIPFNLNVEKIYINQTNVKTIHYSPYFKEINLSNKPTFIHPNIPSNIFIGIEKKDIIIAKNNYKSKLMKNKYNQNQE